MRLPLIAALGLLLTSFGALVMSLAGHTDPAVQHLVTVPGVAERAPSGAVGAAVGVPSGNSPFAVYVPPASTPAPAATSSAAPPASATPAPQPKHHRG